ncbi:MAG: hypothetical protein JNL05_00500 [Flavobacteriales bacterium]|nr:hypothetical protein [Flavobacteriales bacterium]
METQGELVYGGDMPVGVVYHKGRQALFTTRIASSEVPKPSEVVLENQRSQGLAFWGEYDNQFPQKVIADIETSDIIETVIDWKARTLVGEGVMYGNLVEGPGGSQVLKPMQNLEIERWLRRTNFDLFAYEASLDFYRYANANAELQRNLGGEAVGIFSQDQSWLRYGQNDLKTGLIDKAYLCAEWSTVTDLKNKGKVIPLEALDPYYDVVGQLKESRQYRHIIPLRLQTAGRKYYALAPWNGLRASGWLELAVAIPKMKLRLIKNMMAIRYWIEIADSYWPKKFGEQAWKDATDEKRKKWINEEVAAFEQLMAGEEEAGVPKALMTRMTEQKHSGELTSLWKVNPLKLELAQGAYVEDSQETDYHIVRGLGVDPALVGISPSKGGQSPGSGSADRVKRTNYLLGARPHGTRLLSVMDAVSELNGWNTKYNNGMPLTWTFRSLHVATLDRTQQVAAEDRINPDTENGAVQNN